MSHDNDEQEKSSPAYPWARLYNLESRVPGMPTADLGRRGRPPRAYIRRRTTVMLSDEEQSMLDRGTLQIKDALRPATATKSQVFGLAVRLLDHRLRFLPDHADDWEEIVGALFEGEGQG